MTIPTNTTEIPLPIVDGIEVQPLPYNNCRYGKRLCKLANLGVTSVQVEGASAREVVNKARDSFGLSGVDIMCIADAPAKEEDYHDMPLVGEAGDIFTDLIRKAKYDLDTTYCTYMVRCRPPKNRTPAVAEMKACSVHLEREIRALKPKVILLLGATALRLFKLHGKGGVGMIHGKLFEEKLPSWEDGPTFKVIPTYSPLALMYDQRGNLKNRVLEDYVYAKQVAAAPIGSTVYKTAHQADFTVVRTLSQLAELTETLSRQKTFAFDTESTSLGLKSSPMLCFSFSWGFGKNAVVPIYKHAKEQEYSHDTRKVINNHTGKGFMTAPFWSPGDFKVVQEELRKVFEDDKIAKAAHNIKYDINVVKYWMDIEIKGFLYDTMLMHHILDEQRPHDLETLADLEFGTSDYSARKRAITGQGRKLTNTYDCVPDEILWPYAATDAECVWRLLELYYNKIVKRPHLWKLYCEETYPAIRTLAKAEWHGNLIDMKVIDTLKIEYEAKQDTLLIDMRKTTTPDFNPMSPTQVRDAFDSLGYAELIKDENAPSGFTTGKEKLSEISDKVPLAANILTYRTNRKILSTYLENASNTIDAVDGRVRYNWNLHGTESGRLSCPFLHQVPRVSMKRRNRGQYNLRDMFIVPPGYKYVYLDYSQIELRVLAILANDSKMLEMFELGQDIHRATAGAMLGLDVSKVNDFNRQEIGKVTNFGLAYGSKGYQVVKTCQYEDQKGKLKNVTWDMFNQGMVRFKKLYPQLDEYLSSIPDLARINMSILQTPFGRERRFGSRLSQQNPAKREAAEREAVNFTIQSTAGAITIRTLNEVDKMLEQYNVPLSDVALINTVHDSGAYEVRDELVDWFVASYKQIAERTFKVLDGHHFPAKIGVGSTWTEAELAA